MESIGWKTVRITDESGRKTIKAGTVHRLDIGDHVPDLTLVNQDGKSFRLGDFKGKAVLITFIYTRCPVPTFCPRLSSQFAKIQDDLAKMPGDLAKTHFVTISFDPKYDTPAVLRKYGLAYLDNDPAGFSHWDFASTNPGDLRKIADAFGLEYFEEDNQISHSMVIVLISPEGTVAKYWSTDWTTAELEDALRQQERVGAIPTQPQGQRKAG
jgi:protein SCO1